MDETDREKPGEGGDAMRILIVEDDARIRHYLQAVLSSSGYDVLEAANGHSALGMAAQHDPDLILLDLGLPDQDGQELIRSLRTWTQRPIVVVSARGHEQDKVMALDGGADDYVTKPFGTEELLARVRAALRSGRYREGAPGAARRETFKAGGLEIDLARRVVKVDGQPVHLTQNEYKIVALLCRHAGSVLTYDFMIKSIWGPYATCDAQILRVNMGNIRRKIEREPSYPEYIVTEIGVGYRMVEGE